ncbi:hypothetical protein EDD17DRAFT_1765031 [Pisolithus thermaeus]|nr:hypothetical protein EV401DRAFT_2075517 [Pisolithus croceorrhizus]KAI6154307.1 hypothetical protein EDD17DRAFT_1765031 [Pisolithus thermaeus]
MDTTLDLNCVLLGDDSSRIFAVKIPKTEKVCILKDLIKEKQSPILNHVPASALTVWKVSLPEGIITPELTVDETRAFSGAQPLRSVKQISSIFSEALVDEHVHVLVQVPPVEISRTKTINTLKRLIKEEQSHRLNHVDASELTVWKVSLPVGAITPEPTVGEELLSVKKISSIFSEALVDEHVQNAAKFYRPFLLDLFYDLYEHTKRSKIVTNPPSIVGTPDFFESLQKDQAEKILDDRPTPDHDVAPAVLLYEGFGHFLDIMDGRLGVPGLVDIDTTKLASEADEFARKMNENYANEDSRREAVLPCLNRIFKACRGIEITPLHASAIGSVRSDGHNIAAHGAGTMVVQFKNRITGIQVIPEVELTGYVARLSVKGMEVHRKIYLGWRVPCLGLIIFYAVIAVDQRFRLVSLTSMYSCTETAFDGRDRKLLYLAFTAASVFQAQALRDIEKLQNNPPSGLPIAKRGFPAVSKLRKYPPSDDHFHFEIQSFFPETTLPLFICRGDAATIHPHQVHSTVFHLVA